jgi:uncharacterized protein (DUF58 family)
MPAPFFSEDFLQQLERLSLAARKAVIGQTQGERRSPRRGQSVEFSDFRPYVAGDDFRRIDWNAYARLEKFFIKLFVEEEDLTVHFLVDTSRSMRWGEPQKLDYALHAAGALGYISLCGLDRVTVTGVQAGEKPANGQYFPPHRGKRQALALFNFLQNLASDGGAEKLHFDPAGRLRSYAAGASQGGLLVLFSDLMDDGWKEGLSALVSRGLQVSVVHILSPDEVNPELEGDLKLVDVEEGAALEVTADYALLSEYRNHLADWQADLHEFCAKRQINYVPLETSLPLEQLLFNWMKRKGVLR